MRYKVPQKIDLEDRIFGPMTMKQFIYVFAGGTTAYLLFSSFAKYFSMAISLVLASPPALLGLAFAFLKIQDRTFGAFLTSFLMYSLKPKIYLWQRTPDPQIEIERQKATKINLPKKKVDRSDLEKLALLLDTRGSLGNRQNVQSVSSKPFS
jgi:hypothetical protein